MWRNAPMRVLSLQPSTGTATCTGRKEGAGEAGGARALPGQGDSLAAVHVDSGHPFL